MLPKITKLALVSAFIVANACVPTVTTPVPQPWPAGTWKINAAVEHDGCSVAPNLLKGPWEIVNMGTEWHLNKPKTFQWESQILGELDATGDNWAGSNWIKGVQLSETCEAQVLWDVSMERTEGDGFNGIVYFMIFPIAGKCPERRTGCETYIEISSAM